MLIWAYSICQFVWTSLLLSFFERLLLRDKSALCFRSSGVLFTVTQWTTVEAPTITRKLIGSIIVAACFSVPIAFTWLPSAWMQILALSVSSLAALFALNASVRDDILYFRSVKPTDKQKVLFDDKEFAQDLHAQPPLSVKRLVIVLVASLLAIAIVVVTSALNSHLARSLPMILGVNAGIAVAIFAICYLAYRKSYYDERCPACDGRIRCRQIWRRQREHRGGNQWIEQQIMALEKSCERCGQVTVD